MSTHAELRSLAVLALQVPAAVRPRPCTAATEIAPGTRRWPVVLVHGFIGTDAVWAPLCGVLAEAGFGHIVRLRYNSLLADPATVSAATARAALEALITSGCPGVHLVGHSLGGLIVRHAVERDPFLAGRVGVAVTIATPHRGASLAKLAPGPCHRLLTSGLTSGPAYGAERVRWLAYYSDSDRIVPAGSARLDNRPNNCNILIPAAGHLGICRDPRLMRSLVAALGAAELPSESAAVSFVSGAA